MDPCNRGAIYGPAQLSLFIQSKGSFFTERYFGFPAKEESQHQISSLLSNITTPNHNMLLILHPTADGEWTLKNHSCIPESETWLANKPSLSFVQKEH
ncbi:unnamed protein product [Boreogadus saida]